LTSTARRFDAFRPYSSLVRRCCIIKIAFQRYIMAMYASIAKWRSLISAIIVTLLIAVFTMLSMILILKPQAAVRVNGFFFALNLAEWVLIGIVSLVAFLTAWRRIGRSGDAREELNRYFDAAGDVD